MKRLPEGILYKRGKTWWCRCYWLRERGVEYRKSLKTADRRTAEMRYQKFERESADPSPRKIHISEYFDQYLNEYSKQNKIARGHRQDTYRLKRIEAFFKEQRVTNVDDISTRSVELLKTYLSETGSAPKTVNHYLALLRNALNIAVSWGVIDRNPVTISKRLPGAVRPATTTRVRKIRSFSEEEVKLILDTAHKTRLDLYYPARLALNTGLRANEAANLEWEDIDLKNRLLYFQSKGSHSPKARRLDVIPLNKTAVALLKKLRRSSRGRYVFVKDNGQREFGNIYSLTSRFKRFLVRIGIDEPGVAFHTLRHTYITFLLLHGASPRIVMELARIRDLKTLMNYSHVYENHKQSSIEKIGF